ncbi:uncharacterized protein UDID_19096 [Ustilago sp. UG-2017a]|nr:uncharacterized protein UDID_19096 [Ustilago sp. UG-2017a]
MPDKSSEGVCMATKRASRVEPALMPESQLPFRGIPGRFLPFLPPPFDAIRRRISAETFHIAADPTFFPSITCLFLAICSSHPVPLLSPTWTLAIPTDLVSFHCNSTVRIAPHRTRLLRTQQSSTAPCTLLSRGSTIFTAHVMLARLDQIVDSTNSC